MDFVFMVPLFLYVQKGGATDATTSNVIDAPPPQKTLDRSFHTDAGPVEHSYLPCSLLPNTNM
jgi:hypothetical protein